MSEQKDMYLHLTLRAILGSKCLCCHRLTHSVVDVLDHGVVYGLIYFIINN